MTPRRTAFNILYEVTVNGAYANLAIKDALNSHAEKEAQFVSALVYTALDHISYLDYIIDSFARGRLSAKIRCVLRLGVCQLLYMNVPDSAACNESVNLTKQIGKPELSGFVNGIMRTVSANRNALPALPDDAAKRLQIEYGYPDFIVGELLKEYGEEFTKSLLSAPPPETTIRPQFPYTTYALEKYLHAKNIAFTKGKLTEECLRLEKGRDITKDELFQDGKITVQSESAVLVCKALGLKRGMRILDACAAPGGKTACISSLLGGTGSITAFELHSHRKLLTEKTLARLKVKNASVVEQDATVLRNEYIDAFDAVLVDAPCSGLGVGGKPDIRYNKTAGMIEELALLQGRILSACSNYVKPDGILVYATCTITKSENEEQVKAFLKNDPRFELDSLKGLLPLHIADRQGVGMVQLFPNTDETEGFFIARMRRKADR